MGIPIFHIFVDLFFLKNVIFKIVVTKSHIFYKCICSEEEKRMLATSHSQNFVVVRHHRSSLSGHRDSNRKNWTASTTGDAKVAGQKTRPCWSRVMSGGYASIVALFR